MSEQIFRKVAIERLSSPDQLDRLITLTSPTGWLAALALATLLAVVVAWGFLGTVPTRVTGAGILVTRGGQLVDAMAPTAGTLSSAVPVGKEVGAGDVVATLDQTQAEQDLERARDVLRERQREHELTTARLQGEVEQKRLNNEQVRKLLETTAVNAEQRRRFYGDSVEREQGLLAKGFVTQRAVQETRQKMEEADQELRRARNEMLRIDSELIDVTARRDQELARSQGTVNEARRRVEELTSLMGRATRVLSPRAGRVTEVKAAIGTVVAAGRPILSIESGGGGLELVLYLPPDTGKKVLPGMEVRIEPSTVRKEEFGTLLGHVIDVSDFPVSPEGMVAVLQNPELVRSFSRTGAPYAARISLVPAPDKPSGYAWSTGAGPPVRISSGTVAAAEITVRERRPVSLILPLLRSGTGIGT
jgi:HlyD family secretion protein